MTARSEILCIHYYFPPLRSPAVIRNYHIASTFAQYFDHVHVLTSDNHKRFPNTSQTFPDNLSLSSIYTFDYRRMLASRSSSSSHQSNSKKSSPLVQWLLRIQKSYPFNLVLGEGNLIYIIGAYRHAKRLIKERKITTLYSSFGPYADHYVAYLLKGEFPYLRWIADFRDLQIEPIYKNVIWPQYQRKIEARVLQRADLITSVSQGLVDQLTHAGKPTIAVLRGVDLRDSERQYDRFTITYTGSLYLHYRDPRPVLMEIRGLLDEGLLEAEDLQLVYAGRDHAPYGLWVAECGLDHIYHNRGMVSQDEAKSIQNQSHINLLLTSSSAELTGVITGKVFEYFESGNPVLCLINGVHDPEFEHLFDHINAGAVVYHPPIDPSALRTFILSKYQEWKTNGSVASTINKQVIRSSYGWKSQVEKMI